jgi:hypothetical protein
MGVSANRVLVWGEKYNLPYFIIFSSHTKQFYLSRVWGYRH